jgi:hypothetical protein
MTAGRFAAAFRRWTKPNPSTSSSVTGSPSPGPTTSIGLLQINVPSNQQLSALPPLAQLARMTMPLDEHGFLHPGKRIVLELPTHHLPGGSGIPGGTEYQVYHHGDFGAHDSPEYVHSVRPITVSWVE